MRINIIGFSSKGCGLAGKICKELQKEGNECKAFSKTKGENELEDAGNLDRWTAYSFKECDAIVFVGSAGIAVRHIAPHIVDKTKDPAVIVIDELGKHTIPILSGHIGGGNKLALNIAKLIDSVPVITTATDLNDVFSVDVYATENNMHITPLENVKHVSAALLHGKEVIFLSDLPVKGNMPKGLKEGDSGDIGIYVTTGTKRPFKRTLRLVPKCVTIGIGCRCGVPAEVIEEHILKVLKDNDIAMKSIRAAGSIDLKKNEKGMLQFCEKYGIDIQFFTSDELNKIPGEFTESERVLKVTGVGNVCERSALAVSKNGKIVVKKALGTGVTVAVSIDETCVRF